MSDDGGLSRTCRCVRVCACVRAYCVRVCVRACVRMCEPADRVPLSVGALLDAATGAAMVYKDLPYLSSQTDVFIATNQRLVIRTVRRHDLLHSPLHVRTGI